MFSAAPARTPYDLNFEIAGFPIRISPWFWVGSALLGNQLLGNMSIFFLWVVAELISLIVHELGHAFAFRYFGQEAHVVLYHFGGLAIPGRDTESGFSGMSSSYNRSERLQSRFLIALAGPAAGFALAAIVALLIVVAGGSVSVDLRGFPLHLVDADLPAGASVHLHYLVQFLMLFNIYWGLINLLPVLPLDGGQMANAYLLIQDPWGGMVKTLWLSTITGGAVAVLSLLFTQEIFMAMLFGSLAVSSYLALQQTTGGGRPW